MKKFIVRAESAGVFFGAIKKKSKDSVVMTDVRKVYYWDGACAVEQLAVDGTTKPEECKLTVVVKEMEVLSPIQVIPCTTKAIKSLDSVPVWKR